MKKSSLFLAVLAAAVFGGCAIFNPTVVEDKSGIDRALEDMESVYGQVSTIKALAEKNDKAKALLTDKELITQYGRASAFLNSYWKKAAGDLMSGAKIKLSEKDYLARPMRTNVTVFIAMVDEKVKAIPEKETGVEVFIAEQVIKVVQFILDRRDAALKTYREEFNKYLDSLRMVGWNDNFKMPPEPAVVKQKNP